MYCWDPISQHEMKELLPFVPPVLGEGRGSIGDLTLSLPFCAKKESFVGIKYNDDRKWRNFSLRMTQSAHTSEIAFF